MNRSVQRDNDAPVVAMTSPSDHVLTKTNTVTVRGTVTDASVVTATLNGLALVVASDGTYQSTIALSEGPNSVTLVATDVAGNATTVTRSVTLDTTAPVLNVTSPANGASTQDETTTVSGTATDASAVHVTVNGVAAALGGSGAFSASMPLSLGANSFTVVATDSAGNSSTATRSVTRTNSAPVTPPLPKGLFDLVPIDASLGAPASAPSVVSTIGAATEFLYNGPNAVQHGVATGAITKMRAAVVRGRLLTRAGTPLSGVTVRIIGHPELGYTVSRDNGLYDMAIAGGATVTLSFTKAGLFSATRQVQTAWNEFSALDDVTLLAPDTVATHIGFASPIEVARGSAVTDESGSRQATLLFRQGTLASMVLPDGSTRAMPSMTVRATEYTVGARGPQSMPTTLASFTGYTYAVEYSADEAIAAGATEVRFTKPVVTYTDNFLGFPVGALVPAGYYDPKADSWKPSANGRVIKVLSVDGGVATVDVQGQNLAANADTLAKLGIDDVELSRLAALYQPGATLWRVPITHFTIWDWNYFTFLPRLFRTPNLPPEQKTEPQEPNTCDGSEINVQNQILGERFAVQNTPFDLHYSTDRTPGYVTARTIDIPITRDSVPRNVQAISVEISIAGRKLRREWDVAPMDTIAVVGACPPGVSCSPTVSYRFEASSDTSRLLRPGRTMRYTWDGVDAYGRRLNGPQPVSVKVSYYYFGVYGPIGVVYDQGFGTSPTDTTAFTAPIVQTRTLVSASTVFKDFLGAWDARGEGLGGWTLTSHHVYDPIRKMLYKGDGSSIKADLIGPVIRKAIGTGVFGYVDGALDSARVGEVTQIAAGPDGSIAWLDFGRIRQMDTTGFVRTLVNSGNVSGLTMGPDGSIYYADGEGEYRRTPDGTKTLVLGGSYPSFSEGADALAVRDFSPGNNLRAVGPDGTLYLMVSGQIWRVGLDHRLQWVAGHGGGYSGVPGVGSCYVPTLTGPARRVTFCAPSGMAIGPDQSIYVADPGVDNSIRRITSLGMSELVTGGPGSTVDLTDRRALDMKIASIRSLHISPDGILTLVSDGGAKVRQITPDGMLHTVVGNGNGGAVPTDGTLAASTPTYSVPDAVQAADGTIYLPSRSPVIHRVAPALPGLKYGQFFFPSTDGSELYVFGDDGRHLATRDATTLRNVLTFQYDASGALASLTDAGGLVTTVQGSSNGSAASLVSSHGVRTTIDVDPNGFARQLTGPSGYAMTPQHDSLGLLISLRDPRGLPHRIPQRVPLHRVHQPALGARHH
ncbi:MAG: hypothetical protein M3Z05_21955, partial [Gemmatimonadota bacterium]|nr:hypothetical protein [Gemmatimonadota bacterium]